ncbi:MAG: alpha-ribazole phosphatase [Syntrophomonas sp.]
MIIIMVRHGQTDWNFEKRYQGHQDIPLNETGRQQARDLALMLLHESIEAIYSSDLVRARETAEIIAAPHSLSINLDSRLREMSFGLWEGQTFTEIFRDYPNEFDEWFRHTSDFVVPGGESVNLLLERFQAFLKDVSYRHRGTVLLLTHGGVIRSFLFSILGQDPRELWKDGLEPGFMVRLRIEGNDIQVISE